MSAPDPRCQAALERLMEAGAERVYPPSVLPAREVVELSGESIRSRLCAFQDNTSVELAMRPDMTTPIALMLARDDIDEGRYAYSGNVYRLPRNDRRDAVEFEQVGFEWFGADGPDADAEAFGQAFAMVKAADVAPVTAIIGDVGLFHAVVDALGFSEDWADRLKRSFSRMRGPAALLDAALDAGEVTSGSLRLGEALAKLEPEAANRAVEEMLEAKGAPVFAGRSVADIAVRLIARAKSALPDSRSAQLLKSYLEITTDIADAGKALADWARESSVEIGPALEILRQRIDAIASRTPECMDTTGFHAGLGRRFEYYNGFAFEFAEAGRPDAPFLSGGRYNGLISRIDATKSASAIGAAMRADRLPAVGGGR